MIAEAAMQFVEPGQAIFFDDSTTVLQMATHLPSKVPITAITNSLTLMNALKGMHDVTLARPWRPVLQLVQRLHGPHDHQRDQGAQG
jgi:DeoR/GlpR family transcriptional regulator of sugar metabolism